jgi:hypothetical protein
MILCKVVYQEPHTITSQKMAFFIVTTVKKVYLQFEVRRELHLDNILEEATFG